MQQFFIKFSAKAKLIIIRWRMSRIRLIGVNFDSAERNITEYKVKKILPGANF
jgi:hypothetical protein